MGLDMYAYATPVTPSSEVDFNVDDKDDTEIHYWRKHPNLHGWMEELYWSKDGAADSFNCVNVMLTGADLDKLENDIKSGRLPETTGFFFGQSDDDTEDDLAFVAKARKAIKDGATVYYTSWW